MKPAEHARARPLTRPLVLLFAFVLVFVAENVPAGGAEETEPPPPAVTILVAYGGAPDAEANTAHRLASRLKRGVTERLGPQVSVELYPEGRLGPATDRLGAEVDRNVVEIISVAELAEAFPPLEAARIPFLFSDLEAAQSFFDSSDFVARAGDVLSERLGAELYSATVSGGPRAFTTTGRMLRTPADFEGLGLLVGSASEAATVDAFDARGEVATAEVAAELIPGGEADGWIATAEEIASLGLGEELRFRTDLAVSYPALFVLGYDSGLSALEPEQREAVREAARDAARAVSAAVSDNASEAEEALRAGGVEFYRPSAAEAELFARLGQAAYIDSIEKSVSLEWIMLALEQSSD